MVSKRIKIRPLSSLTVLEFITLQSGRKLFLIEKCVSGAKATPNSRQPASREREFHKRITRLLSFFLTIFTKSLYIPCILYLLNSSHFNMIFHHSSFEFIQISL